MKFTQIASRASLLVGIMGFAGTLFAGSIPISGQAGDNFYSIQLRGISFDAGGENVAVTIYDYTDDFGAFGSITITNTDTSAVVFSNVYDNSCLCFGVGSYTDEATFELAPGNYSVTESAHEFSSASVLFGGTTEASAGYFNGAPDPSFNTDFSIPATVPEPASSALIVLGMGALGIWRRKAVHCA